MGLLRGLSAPTGSAAGAAARELGGARPVWGKTGAGWLAEGRSWTGGGSGAAAACGLGLASFARARRVASAALPRAGEPERVRRAAAAPSSRAASPRRPQRDPDWALGVPLRQMGSIQWPQEDEVAQKKAARQFAERFVTPRRRGSRGQEPRHAWSLTRPCVIRGFARDWDFVRRGRLDPQTEDSWRTLLEGEVCPTEFQPSPSHLKYEVVPSMDPSLRLVSPAMVLCQFGDFLDACHLKRQNQRGPWASAAAKAPVRSVLHANVAYEGPGWQEDPRCLPNFPRNVDVDFGASGREFSVYCAQHDVSHWPQEVLGAIAPCSPAERLMPDWAASGGATVNTWMCGGGPHGGPVSCGFHCDFSENLHVVLSGRKEFTLCHPSDIAVLHGASSVAQAAWSVTGASRDGAPPEAHLQELVRGDLRTPMCLASIDASFEDNCQLCPGLRLAADRRLGGASSPSAAGLAAELLAAQVQGIEGLEDLASISSASWHPSGPLRATLRAGDVVYIPPGWFHTVRTWAPGARSREKGLPLSLSVNFWHQCQDEMWEKEKLFRMLEVCSIRQALVGDKEAMLEEFLAKLRAAGEAEAT